MKYHQTADLRAPVGSSTVRLKPGCWKHQWWMKRGGGVLWCVLYCFVWPPWTSAGLTYKLELSIYFFFFSPSLLSSPCGLTLSCSVLVLATRGQIEKKGASGGRWGWGGSAYQARGCLILRRHCLKGCRGRQRNWSD